MSFQYPMNQGHDLGEMVEWGAPRRHRATRGPSVFARSWDGVKHCFATMLHGAQGQKSAWTEMLEEAPAWLVSVVVHFLMVVILGLCAVGVQQKIAEMEVAVAPAYNFSDNELGESIGSGLDEGAPGLLAEEFNPLLPPTPSISDLPSDSELAGAVADVDADWQELVVSEDGNPSLMSGTGDGPFGPGGGGNGGQGNGVTSVFGLAGEGGKFVYVFDRSESMNSIFTLYSGTQIISSITPLKSAKMEMSRSLGSLGEYNQFQIVFYNDDPTVFGEDHYGRRLFDATEDNKQRANEYINDMKAVGFTNHLAALETAIALNPNVIFLLTDGEAKDDLHPNMVRKLYKLCRRKKILLNVVHFCAAPREQCTLIRLAEKTGGQHRFIKLEDLAEKLAQPSAEFDGKADGE